MKPKARLHIVAFALAAVLLLTAVFKYEAAAVAAVAGAFALISDVLLNFPG